MSTALPSTRPYPVAQAWKCRRRCRARYGGDRMTRREFITLLGASAAAWPLAARAQIAGMPVIGWLDSVPLEGRRYALAIFREGLNRAGYVVGQNVALEYRSAQGQYDRLPALSAELAARRVA